MLLHECGHAYHDMLSAHAQPLFWNLGGPSEFAELAAMAMVALALPHLAVSAIGLSAEQARRVRAAYLEEVDAAPPSCYPQRSSRQYTRRRLHGANDHA